MPRRRGPWPLPHDSADYPRDQRRGHEEGEHAWTRSIVIVDVETRRFALDSLGNRTLEGLNGDVLSETRVVRDVRDLVRQTPRATRPETTSLNSGEIQPGEIQSESCASGD